MTTVVLIAQCRKPHDMYIATYIHNNSCIHRYMYMCIFVHMLHSVHVHVYYTYIIYFADYC